MRNSAARQEKKAFIRLERNDSGEILAVREQPILCEDTDPQFEAPTWDAEEREPLSTPQQEALQLADVRTRKSRPRLSDPLPNLGAFDDEPTEASLATAAGPRPPSLPPVWLRTKPPARVGAALVFAAATAALGMAARGTNSHVASLATTETSEQMVPRRAILEVHASPEAAHIRIDRGPDLGATASTVLTLDGRFHLVQVSAPGFVPRSEEVWITGDTVLRFALEPDPAAGSTSPSSRR